MILTTKCIYTPIWVKAKMGHLGMVEEASLSIVRNIIILRDSLYDHDKMAEIKDLGS